MKKEAFDYTNPKIIRNEATTFMLAELWANSQYRDYLMNQRNLFIKGLKNIKTGTLEGNALELERKNGSIEAIEYILVEMKNAFADLNKRKPVSKEQKFESATEVTL